MHSQIHFQLQELRSQNIQKVLEAVLGLFTALFVTALLPSLLVRYVYSQEQLMQQPAALELVPLISFVLAMLYVIWVAVGIIRRSTTIKSLKLQMEDFSEYSGETTDEMITQEELDELENIVEQAISEVEEAEAKSSKGKKKASKTKSKAESKKSKNKKSKSKKKSK